MSDARMDELNREFADKPLVTSPPDPTRSGKDRAAAYRLSRIKRHIEIEGRRVLDFGTGVGSLATAVLDLGGAASAIGVDVKEYEQWSVKPDPRLTFKVGDIADGDIVGPGSLDVVVSNAVFEHVRRPIQTLGTMYEALVEGGEAYLNFNLHRGRKASHRYRHITFPWPHLIFTEDEAKEMLGDKAAKYSEGGFAWVNKMTAAHYLQVSRDLGFEIVDFSFQTIPVADDLDFYLRFESVLGRYPAFDLEADFMELVLRKTAAASDTVPRLPYVERQRALDEALAKHRASEPG